MGRMLPGVVSKLFQDPVSRPGFRRGLEFEAAVGPWKDRGWWAVVAASGGPLIATPATHFIYPGVIGCGQAGGAIKSAALEIDPAARTRAWAEVDRLLVQQAVAIPETFDNQASLESGNVAGVNAIWDSGVWDLDFTSLK
jgi:hypothetical protein